MAEGGIDDIIMIWYIIDIGYELTSSYIILQKSVIVFGKGPWVEIYFLLHFWS